MRIVNRLITIVAASVLSLAAAEFSIDDSHSQVGFEVKHMMISKVRGQFHEYMADIAYDKKKGVFTSLEGTVSTASIDTDNEKRDNHLKSPDFFDVEKFPEMKFVMTEYKGDKNGGKAKGNLTIKDVTKPVVFDVDIGGIAEDPWGNTRIGFTAQTTIDRKDFGLNWNKVLEAGGFLVGDEIKIVIEIEGIEI